MLLSDLPKIIKIKKTYNYKRNKSFSSVTSNSKLINKKTIFIYNNKTKAKKKYILEAIKNKTPAIITNEYFNFINIPQFLVLNIEYETEKILKKIYKNLPHKTIAVTGTNGKTSVVWYVTKILNLLNFNNTSVGTLGYFKNGKKIEDVNLTTPAYEEIYRYGSELKKNKKIFIFEASSHSLDQNRIRNFPIHIAAITNITKDHLDYHKSVTNYKRAKLKLFNSYLKKKGTAIINSRIKNISKLSKLLESKNIRIIYFGKKDIYFKKNKSNLEINIYNKKYHVKNLNLNSKIELENIECAIACCLALGISQNKILKSLKHLTNPPGRLQKLEYIKKKSTIIIDYAHTPDALTKVLKAHKLKNNKKPILLFGCGGERDKAKRKTMGKIANKLAIRTYITDDNPRNEDPSKIRKSILKYCHNGIEIPDRKEAIKISISELKTNQVLIIAGKGHEKYQIINNKKIKFDDYNLVKNIIKK